MSDNCPFFLEQCKGQGVDGDSDDQVWPWFGRTGSSLPLMSVDREGKKLSFLELWVGASVTETAVGGNRTGKVVWSATQRSEWREEGREGGTRKGEG